MRLRRRASSSKGDAATPPTGYDCADMEVIVLGLISGLRPATSQAAVFALLRSPSAARGLLAFAAAGFVASVLIGLIAVGAIDGAGGVHGPATCPAAFGRVPGVAALGFGAVARGGGLDRGRGRSSARAPSAIATRL